MATVILDEELAERLKAERAERGGDRYDEVWEGVYMMAAMPNNEHQFFVNRLARILDEVIHDSGIGQVFPGCNVSDREDWEKNFRVPDLAVFLNGTNAIDRSTFWLGGPDFAVEITSRGDKSRDKFEFYASVNTREVLIIDRDPWQMELYRLEDGALKLVENCLPGNENRITASTVGLQLRLDASDASKRPFIHVSHPRHKESGRSNAKTHLARPCDVAARNR